MMPMIGARNTEKDDKTAMKVVARLISCHGCTIQAAMNVMMAPRRMSVFWSQCQLTLCAVLRYSLMYLGNSPARSMPPAMAFPQIFSTYVSVSNLNAHTGTYFEHCSESKTGGEEKYTYAGFGRAIAIIHHSHQQVRWVPV